MANRIAVDLDRRRVAEMSCIAGIGAGIQSFIHQARQADVMIAIDGCPLECARQCLEQKNLRRPDLHYELSKFGVRKALHEDFDKAQAEFIMNAIAQDISVLK